MEVGGIGESCEVIACMGKRWLAGMNEWVELSS
jgi:hypothetical protein